MMLEEVVNDLKELSAEMQDLPDLRSKSAQRRHVKDMMRFMRAFAAKLYVILYRISSEDSERR